VRKFLLLAAVAGWVSAPRPAHAYLDPATGSAVLQVLVGSVMGGLFVAKRYWGQLKARFTKRSTDPEPTTEDTRPDSDRG